MWGLKTTSPIYIYILWTRTYTEPQWGHQVHLVIYFYVNYCFQCTIICPICTLSVQVVGSRKSKSVCVISLSKCNWHNAVWNNMWYSISSPLQLQVVVYSCTTKQYEKQYVHFRSHTEYFPLPWKTLNRWSTLFHN